MIVYRLLAIAKGDRSSMSVEPNLTHSDRQFSVLSGTTDGTKDCSVWIKIPRNYAFGCVLSYCQLQ